MKGLKFGWKNNEKTLEKNTELREAQCDTKWKVLLGNQIEK